MNNQSDLREMLRNLRREPIDQELPLNDVSMENSLGLNNYEVNEEANNSNNSSIEMSSIDNHLFSNNCRASTAPVKANDEDYYWYTQFNYIEKTGNYYYLYSISL